MKKKLLLVVLGVVILVAGLSGMKALQIGAMIKQGKSFVPPPVTVTEAAVSTESWSEELTAVGTLTAVQGVTVAAELPGKVVRIAFEPGRPCIKGICWSARTPLRRKPSFPASWRVRSWPGSTGNGRTAWPRRGSSPRRTWTAPWRPRSRRWPR